MTAGLGRRARSLEEMVANMQALEGFELKHFRPLEARPDDVFITTWAKSGTTYAQQMFHQLRMLAATGEGDMDFDDISRMTPWEDSAVIVDMDMNIPQKASPRGFKSHREYERLPAGSRYVVTLRDPKETFVSFYRFMSGWMFETGSIPIDHFFPLWMSGGPGGCDYYTHLLSWYARRHENDTLLATYRWAVKNRPEMIRRLATFSGIALKEEHIDVMLEMTSREFMFEHKDKFDDAMNSRAFEEKIGIPADSDSTKVQAVGSDAKEVPPAIAAQIDALWAERVEPVTGHKDFASLAAEIDALA